MGSIRVNPVTGSAQKAIQDAIDQCFLSGGGTVKLTSGRYEIASIRLRSNVTLYLSRGVELIGSRNPDEYNILENDLIEPIGFDQKTDVLWESHSTVRNNDFILKSGSRWNNAMIRIVNAHDCAIVGEGAVIDGSDCYDSKGEEHYRGPHGICIRNSKNLFFSGYTIKNTGNWAHCAYFSREMRFESLTILAGHDGVHFAACDNVTVRACDIQTGDDCVAGFDNRDVRVLDCSLNTACSGLRFGGTDVLVKNCRFYGPAKHYFRGSLPLVDKISGNPAPISGRKNMLSMFTYYSDFTLNVRSEPRNIVIEDCAAENIDRFLHYNFSGNEYWQCNAPLAQIAFKRVTANGISMPLCAYGSADKPVTLEMEDCALSFVGVDQMIKAAYYKLISLKKVTVSGVKGALITSYGGEGDLKTENLTGIEPNLERSAEEFSCQPI